jgi:hypothetical protein
VKYIIYYKIHRRKTEVLNQIENYLFLNNKFTIERAIALEIERPNPLLKEPRRRGLDPLLVR